MSDAKQCFANTIINAEQTKAKTIRYLEIILDSMGSH